MKKAICLTLVLVCISISSCSASEYKDGIACVSVSSAVIDSLSDGLEYTEFDSTHREFYFKDVELYDDCSLIYSTYVNDINEIGVFHATSEENAKRVEDICRVYIEDMRRDSRAFIASYSPDELPKLDAAEVKRMGRYVIYAVLPENMLSDAFDAAEKALS